MAPAGGRAGGQVVGLFGAPSRWLPRRAAGGPAVGLALGLPPSFSAAWPWQEPPSRRVRSRPTRCRRRPTRCGRTRRASIQWPTPSPATPRPPTPSPWTPCRRPRSSPRWKTPCPRRRPPARGSGTGPRCWAPGARRCGSSSRGCRVCCTSAPATSALRRRSFRWGWSGGGMRLYYDGVEHLPMEGSVPDLSRVALSGLERVRVVRRAGGVDVLLFRRVHGDKRPHSLVEAGTGDQDTNVLRATFSLPPSAGRKGVPGAGTGWTPREGRTRARRPAHGCATAFTGATGEACASSTGGSAPSAPTPRTCRRRPCAPTGRCRACGGFAKERWRKRGPRERRWRRETPWRLFRSRRSAAARSASVSRASGAGCGEGPRPASTAARGSPTGS